MKFSISAGIYLNSFLKKNNYLLQFGFICYDGATQKKKKKTIGKFKNNFVTFYENIHISQHLEKQLNNYNPNNCKYCSVYFLNIDNLFCKI